MADETLESLISRLASPDPLERMHAANALGSFGAPPALSPELLGAIAKQTSPGSTAARARELLMGLRGRSTAVAAVPALTAALADPDARVRGLAASALGKIGAPAAAAIPGLCALLQDDLPATRVLVAAALGQIGDPGAVSALTSALDDPAHEVRARAAFALGRIGPPAVTVATRLAACLKDPSLEVQERAAHALGMLGAGVAEEALVALAAAAASPGAAVRCGAVCSLGRLGARAELETIVRALEDPDALVRGSAAQALRALGWSSPEGVEALVRALGDAEAVVRRDVVLALAALGGEVAARALAEHTDADPRVREALAQAGATQGGGGG
ncbi:MAG: HEAT repeat domain-containing protein [Planctomycetes bacterium]|nr:HEAT repeat domain-containing protein [Planctomycetota bacterium]